MDTSGALVRIHALVPYMGWQGESGTGLTDKMRRLVSIMSGTCWHPIQRAKPPKTDDLLGYDSESSSSGDECSEEQNKDDVGGSGKLVTNGFVKRHVQLLLSQQAPVDSFEREQQAVRTEAVHAVDSSSSSSSETGKRQRTDQETQGKQRKSKKSGSLLEPC